jgi:hypothetical protein
LHDYSSTLPAPAGRERAVIAEAERIVRAEDDRVAARARRASLQEERRRLARDERERKAVAARAEEERRREAAARLRESMPDRIRERGRTCGADIMAGASRPSPIPVTRGACGIPWPRRWRWS